ncbi:MAG: hypothetical protein HYV07_25590 [Deltaproteobacteria bacterium]|nr:hypothetical protein [Deltaproteobacteria bacterium]
MSGRDGDRAALALGAATVSYSGALLLDLPRALSWIPGKGPVLGFAPESIGWYSLCLYGAVAFALVMLPRSLNVPRSIGPAATMLTAATAAVLAIVELGSWLSSN